MLLRRTSYIFFLFALAATYTGCDFINPEEDVPSYIRIEKIEFNPGSRGAASHKIQDAWVYVSDGVENKLVGAFELPVNIPILKAGPHRVTIQAGTYADGIRQARFAYPFYNNALEQEVNLVPGQIITLSPVATYRSNLDFIIEEDFQDLQLEMQTPSGSVYKLVNESDDSLQFEHSQGQVGVVYSKKDTLAPIVIESVFNGKLRQGGQVAYLELDYKSELEFRVGTEANLNGTIIKNDPLRLKPNREWNKVYVNLTEEISTLNNAAANFKIIITTVPTSGNGKQYIAIDNVRLIQFRP